MEKVYFITSLWLVLAVISAIIAYHIRISIILVEICVGIILDNSNQIFCCYRHCGYSIGYNNFFLKKVT